MKIPCEVRLNDLAIGDVEMTYSHILKGRVS